MAVASFTKCSKIIVLIILFRIFPEKDVNLTILYIHFISLVLFLKFKYLSICIFPVALGDANISPTLCAGLMVSASSSLCLLGPWGFTSFGGITASCHGLIYFLPSPLSYPFQSEKSFPWQKKCKPNRSSAVWFLSHPPSLRFYYSKHNFWKPFLLPVAVFTIFCSLCTLILSQPRSHPLIWASVAWRNLS